MALSVARFAIWTANQILYGIGSRNSLNTGPTRTYILVYLNMKRTLGMSMTPLSVITIHVVIMVKPIA